MILAADLGSTNLKAALFAKDGCRVGEASCPLPYEIQSSSRAELSPEAVTCCFFDVVADLLARAGTTIEKVHRVSLTSQAQTFCICDNLGNSVSPFFGWTDLRAEEECAELQGAIGELFHLRTGWPTVRPGHMISKVLWWRNEHGMPEDHRVVSLPSYLGMRLGAAHVSDSNLAAMSGFYSIPDKTWWADAAEAAGITSTQLGLVVEPGLPVPTDPQHRPPGYSESLKLVFAGNDHSAGAVGCGCRKGRSVMTLGTAGVYYRWVGRKPGPFSTHGLWGPYPGGGYYELLHIPHACSALDWADQHLFGSVDSSRFVESAGHVEVGSTTPLFDPNRWGNTTAWSDRTDIGSMAYAVLEGIAFALRLCAGELPRRMDEEIQILGGGSKLDFWVQLLANIFQCPFARSKQDGLDGAAMLAGLRLPVDCQSGGTTRFLPEPAVSGALECRYQMWREHFANPGFPHSKANQPLGNPERTALRHNVQSG